MDIGIVVSVIALLAALYAIKSVKGIDVGTGDHVHDIDTYSRREIEQQVQGAMDAIEHLQGRVYELRARVDKLEANFSHLETP